MKKSLLMIAAVLLFAAPAMAGIATTKHNLGNTGTGGQRTVSGTSEICIFCHTPHNANAAGPLWNRNTVTVAGTYTSPTLNNQVNLTYLNSKVAVAPLCLSCHDGASALGAAVAGLGVQNTFQKSMTIGAMTGNAAIGLDGTLSNDHPIGMQYNAALDTSPYGVSGLRGTTTAVTTVPSEGPNAAWFRSGTDGATYTLMMDCSTCHDVHGKDSNPKFLRRSNGSSNFCITCHDK